MNIGQIRVALMKNSNNFLWSCSKRNFRCSVTCMQKREKEKWPHFNEKWDRPKEEWSSFFHYFSPEKGITVDIVHRLQKPIDVSPKSILGWLKRHGNARDVIAQSYLEERVAALGCELAAAHFIVSRNGRIRLKESNDWIVTDQYGDYILPRYYIPGYIVECIDASGTNLLYEGLECIDNLGYLKWLNLSDCVNIDDWCVDRICGQYSSTLEYLNIANCTAITDKGIAALVRLRKLKTLDLTGLHNIENIELLCLLIEDLIPNIDIIGINYMDPSVLEGKVD